MPVRYDSEWQQAAQEYRNAEFAASEAKKAVEVARDNLLALTDVDASGFGVSVKFTERKGSVDYAGIVKEHLPQIDVEQFRKASVSTTNIKVSKEG